MFSNNCRIEFDYAAGKNLYLTNFYPILFSHGEDLYLMLET